MGPDLWLTPSTLEIRKGPGCAICSSSIYFVLGGGVKSGYTSHTKPDLFMSRITLYPSTLNTQRCLMYATGMRDTTGSGMARVPPLHRTKFAVPTTPKNLRLPPNLKVETITSCKTSRKASSGVSIDRSFTVTIPLHSPCSEPLPASGASISTAINLITPQVIL